MKFSDTVGIEVFNDAWETWDQWFRSENDPSIKLPQFLQMALEAKPVWLRLTDLIQDPPENLAVKRLLARTAQDAYPDKPRGSADVASIRHHMKSDNVSPVVLIRIANKLILLDGMHRLVAARLAHKRFVRAIVLE